MTSKDQFKMLFEDMLADKVFAKMMHANLKEVRRQLRRQRK